MRRVLRVATVPLSIIGYVWHHPANDGARGRAVLRAVAFQAKTRLRLGPVVARVGNSMELEAPLHATGASKAVYANPPDWNEMQAWRCILRSGDLFVDVGSNAGLYSVWAADCGATPIAIEPDPTNAERTEHNLTRNGITPEMHVCAVAAEPGVMRFTSDMDTVNHLLNEGEAQPSREVRVSTLDAVIAGRHVRGIKVDVEGAERLVVEGAQQTLANQRADVLQLEWNQLSMPLLGETREPVRKLLEEFGYTLCRPDVRSFTLVPMSPDDMGTDDVFAVSASMSLELFPER